MESAHWSQPQGDEKREHKSFGELVSKVSPGTGQIRVESGGIRTNAKSLGGKRATAEGRAPSPVRMDGLAGGVPKSVEKVT
jgi:hypothetical protein